MDTGPRCREEKGEEAEGKRKGVGSDDFSLIISD